MILIVLSKIQPPGDDGQEHALTSCKHATQFGEVGMVSGCYALQPSTLFAWGETVAATRRNFIGHIVIGRGRISNEI